MEVANSGYITLDRNIADVKTWDGIDKAILRHVNSHLEEVVGAVLPLRNIRPFLLRV